MKLKKGEIQRLRMKVGYLGRRREKSRRLQRGLIGVWSLMRILKRSVPVVLDLDKADE
jgi:transcription initiation factor TFIID subunit TAF12